MKMPKRLLAKSIEMDTNGQSIDCEHVYLPGHLKCALESALSIVDLTGKDQLAALDLEIEKWFPRLQKVVCLGAALHDLGKANDHFQGMLQPDFFPDRRGRLQGLRHEWVTYLILREAIEWLFPALDNDPINWLAMESAITGHHPAYERPSPPCSNPAGSGSEMIIFSKHQDFEACLDIIRDQFNLENNPSHPLTSIHLSGSGSVFKKIRNGIQEHHQNWDTFSPEEKRFVASCKACLIAADIAGSALPEEISELSQQENWIKAAFSAIPRPEQIADILACRLHCAVEEIEDRLRPFQKEAAEKAGPITFLKAGCGTGKTLAAYHWAREHCPGKRVYICYPTTGTATEGFRDYLFNPDEKTGKYGADLFTSRADVDKAIILGIHRGREEEDPEEGVIRIESLKAWSTPMVSCTVDTVLGLIQNNRRGLYAWPALAGAAFVFDEIHAYDDKLFGALLRFLEALHGVPVLLMTASLPQIRLEILRNKCQKMGIGLVEIDGPKEIEEIPRYHRQGTIDNQDPLPAIQREYVRGGKILWVCNTVNRAMDAYDRAKVAGLEPILYHSRFRYEDRVQQHQQVIARFKEYEPQAALAICTQVAEMSLDLSASLLVTDLAPVPALIQRLGRLNRRANKGDPTCLFIVIEPVDEAGDPENLPYTAAELDSARRWLGVLPETGISQLDLAQVWEVKIEDSKERRPAYCPSAWLDGGPITNVLELREGSPGITVIQERDRQRVVEDYRELKKVLIPMNPPPRHQEWHKWPRYRGIPIAPEGTIEYHEERGARWQKKEQK